MSTSLIIVIIVLVVIGGYVVGTYNVLIALIEAVKNNHKQIDIQLDRRFKVFESLINVVKKYMDYEKTTLKEVVKLRNLAQQEEKNGNESARMRAEDKISAIAGNINVVFEQYPDLKADKNVMQLQEEIVNTENKLSYAKQAYNDSIERYNAKKKSFFAAMVVAMFSGKLDFEFHYWQLSTEQVEAQENFRVNLD